LCVRRTWECDKATMHVSEPQVDRCRAGHSVRDNDGTARASATF